MSSTIEQIYTACLAQGSYFIESNGEAAVIDPLRESEPYIRRAEERGVKIKYIFETHFHADFVSGHVDLAKKTGAQIVYGPTAVTDFDIIEATDGQVFKIGDIEIEVLHTPGHTPESSCYLLRNEQGNEHCLFTGDTLFIGDVGRPDLAQKATNLSQEDLAGWLFDSLRNKIMPLDDNLIIYPAHGAGSSCGKNMSSETWSTLGEQKVNNYALRSDMSRSEFIEEVTDGLLAPPQYFSKNAALNKKGYNSIDEVMKKGLKPLSVEEFDTLAKADDTIILDVRAKDDFGKSFIPGSIFIGLDGSFAPWVGALVENLNQKILLVTPAGREAEAVRRLARVGYDNAIGFIDGGVDAWSDAGKVIHSITTISAEDFQNIQGDKDSLNIIDVRKPGEYESTHLKNAISYPLDFINSEKDTLDKDLTLHLHCRSGYRSTVASSILKSRGYNNIVNVLASFEDLKKCNVNLEGSCPSLVS
jgi:glyoxylase-like metal-dependent hydrolase (beta-lactamase superfamily II)/rhodanese-related sulfurtransferase